MYKHCTTEESAHRQRHLEQCLLRLMAETPYNGITIGMICQKAELSRKSFYRYFDSKDSCLHALLDHTIMDGSTYYVSDTRAPQKNLAMCIRIFEYWQSQALLLTALEKNGMSLQLLQRMIRYILEEEPEYAAHMGISRDILMEHIVYTVGGMMGLVITWHHEGYRKSTEQMGAILYRLMQTS